MIIKAVKYREAVKRIMFIKKMSESKVKEWLKVKNVIDADDVFIILDSEMNVGIKIHICGEPKEIKLNL